MVIYYIWIQWLMLIILEIAKRELDRIVLEFHLVVNKLQGIETHPSERIFFSASEYYNVNSFCAETFHAIARCIAQLVQRKMQPIPFSRTIQAEADEVSWPEADKGGSYRGQVKNGCKDGYGATRYPNGDVYDGEWSNNQRCGIGVYVGVDGSRYEGQWYRDMQNGFGTYIWPNCDRYE